MLNMKKGLAIVLAAATALTFAPVSTLGLTGLVQAQAAAIAGTQGYATQKLAEQTPLAQDWSQAAGTVAVDLTDADKSPYFVIKVTGESSGSDEYTYTSDIDDTDVVSTWADKGLEVSDAEKFDMKANASTQEVKELGFVAKKGGTAKITLTRQKKDKSDAKKTTVITVTVTGTVTTEPTFKDGTTKVESLNLYKGDNKTLTLDFGKDTGSAYFFKSDDETVAKVDNASPTTNGTGIQKGTITAGTTTTPTTGSLKITAVAEGKAPANILVYSTAKDAKDGKNVLATLPVTVVNKKFSVDATDTVVGKARKVTYINADSTTTNVTLTIKNTKTGADATDSFWVLDDDAGNNKPKTTTTSRKFAVTGIEGTLWVEPKDNTPAGSYTVTLTDDSDKTNTASDTFTVGGSGSGSTKPDSPAAAANSAVFGGVITDLYATDNTSYNLVSSDAEFELNNTRYTANQLKWYLTKAPTKTPENMGLTTGAGSIAASTTGKLNVTVSNAEQFAQDINGTTSDPDPDPTDNAYIVGVYTSGADNTIVYSHPLLVKHADKGYVTKNYDAGTISTSINAIATADPANQISDSFLNGVKFIGVNNKYLKGKDIDSLDFTKAIYNGTHFNATLAKGGDGDEVLKGSKLTAHANEVVRDGVYYETFYVPYTEKDTNGKFVAAITVKVSVSAGPVVEIKEGNFTYSLKETEKKDQALRDQKVIDLDLTTNKTFDIAAHAVSNKDNTSYTYDPDTQNVTVDAKGVVTAAKVGTAVVTVTPTANGVKGASVYVFFRVNKNANDQISVTGKDGDKATVLTTRQYNANTNRLSTEDGLAKAQVGYVQIEVTGDETADVKEDLTVKGNGTLSFSLAKDPAHKESVDAKTGQITIPHEYLNDHFKDAKAGIQPFVFPVKVVSTETNSSALTTGYFYVVVDYADASITGLEDSYNVGTSITETGSDSWLNLGKDRVYESNDKTTTYVPVHVSSNAEIATSQITKNDDLDDSKIYDADDSTVFINDYAKHVVRRAIVSGKTEHVLVSADDTEHKVGHTYKVVTVNSVAGQNNYVTKIENVETGKTVYQQGAGVNSGASIVINKPTVVKVTVAHAPSATLNANYDPAFTISRGGNEFNYNTDNLFVAATENPNTYEITLIPSAEGTQIVSIYPTEGRLSESDYSLVSTDAFNLAVKYSTADSKTPAQVKGVKLGNKKGAKVVVKFTKDTTDKNIKYYVQKKVGKKTSGKSVGSNRTILSVKKGDTVKVRVKAYYYDANGVKHVGKYSKWVTKKTDKK